MPGDWPLLSIMFSQKITILTVVAFVLINGLCCVCASRTTQPTIHGPIKVEQDPGEYVKRLPLLNGTPLPVETMQDDFEKIMFRSRKQRSSSLPNLGETGPRPAGKQQIPLSFDRDLFDDARDCFVWLRSGLVGFIQPKLDIVVAHYTNVKSLLSSIDWTMLLLQALALVFLSVLLAFLVLTGCEMVRKSYSGFMKYSGDSWLAMWHWYYSKRGWSSPPIQLLESSPSIYTRVGKIIICRDQYGKEAWFKTGPSGMEPYAQPQVLEKEMAVPGSLLLKSNTAGKLVVILGDGCAQAGCGAIVRHKGGFWLTTAEHVYDVAKSVLLGDGRWMPLSRYIDTNRKVFIYNDFAMLPITPVMGTDLGVKAMEMASWTTFAARSITILTRTDKGEWAQSSGKTVAGVKRSPAGLPLFCHTATTHPGFSGSPVVIESQGRYFYLGTHLGASPANNCNYYYPLSLVTKKSLSKPTELVVETDYPLDGYSFSDGDESDLGEYDENVYFPDDIIMSISNTNKRVTVVRASEQFGLSRGGNKRWADYDEDEEKAQSSPSPIQYKQPNREIQESAPAKPDAQVQPSQAPGPSTKRPIAPNRPLVLVKPPPEASLATIADMPVKTPDPLICRYTVPVCSNSGKGQAPSETGLQAPEFAVIKAFRMRPRLHLVDNEPIFFCNVGKKLIIEPTVTWMTKQQWSQRSAELCNSGPSVVKSSQNQEDKSPKATTTA